jgi:hypothetical protein
MLPARPLTFKPGSTCQAPQLLFHRPRGNHFLDSCVQTLQSDPRLRSTQPWPTTSPSPMRFGASILGSPVRDSPFPSRSALQYVCLTRAAAHFCRLQVRFGAHCHSSPPLSFLAAPRSSAGSALGNSQKSLPPFSLLDYGGDSRGSLGAAGGSELKAISISVFTISFVVRRSVLSQHPCDVLSCRRDELAG